MTTARSRVFAELGAAQWCRRLDEREPQNWVDTATSDYVQHPALLLAAQTDLRILPLLLEHPQLAARALDSGAPFTNDQRGLLLDRLIALLTPTNADAQNTATAARPNMPVIQLIAELSLGGSSNTRRVDALRSLDLSSEDRACVLVTATVAAAIAENRPLAPVEVDNVMAMLSLPLPTDTPKPTTRDGIRSFRGGTLLPRSRVAIIHASERIEELPDTATELITSLVQRMSTGDVSRVDANLSRKGCKTVMGDIYATVISTMNESSRQLLHDFRTLLHCIGDLSAIPVTLTPQQRWRLPNLNHLLHALGFGSTTGLHDLHSVAVANTNHLTGVWLKTTAQAAGLDTDTLAAEASDMKVTASCSLPRATCSPRRRVAWSVPGDCSESTPRNPRHINLRRHPNGRSCPAAVAPVPTFTIS